MSNHPYWVEPACSAAAVKLLQSRNELNTWEGPVIVVDPTIVAGVVPVRYLTALVARRTLQAVLVNVDHVPALAGVVTEALPGQRIIGVTARK